MCNQSGNLYHRPFFKDLLSMVRSSLIEVFNTLATHWMMKMKVDVRDKVRIWCLLGKRQKLQLRLERFTVLTKELKYESNPKYESTKVTQSMKVRK
jgi:hypothetical protein